MKVTLLHKQSLLDIALQVYGSMDVVLQLALVLGVSVTADLEPGTVVDLPELDQANLYVQNIYESKSIKPATELYNADLFYSNPTGIDYMIIETDFIVE